MRRSAILATALVGVLAALASARPIPPSSKSNPPSTTPSTSPKEPPTFNGKTLKQWKAQLIDKDASKRVEAILAVLNFGEAASECVPLLIARTTDYDASPRVKAVIALRFIHIDKNDKHDKNDNRDKRDKRGKRDKRDKRKVGEASVIRRKVIEALVNRIRFPSALSPTSGEPQAIVRFEAIRTLMRFYPDADLWPSTAIPTLATAATKDMATWEIRQHAMALMWRAAGTSKAGPNKTVVDALLQGIRDANFQVRLEAVMGLGGMGHPSDPALLLQIRKALIACINDGGTSARSTILHIWAYTALVALADLDDRGREPHLRGISAYLNKKYDPEVRSHAAQALGALGKQAKSQVPVLLGQLGDKQPFAVQGAVGALVAIGDKGPPVIAGLKSLLASESPLNVAAACQALIHFKAGTPDVIDALKPLLASKEPANAMLACQALILLKADTPDVIDALKPLLASKEPVKVMLACQAFVHFKAARPDVMLALQEQLDRPNLDPGLKAVIDATVKQLLESAKKKRP
jgi:HEAT repeat protein